MPAIRAVIFDMYETLVVNNSGLWIETFDEICETQGLPFDGQELWNRWKPLEMLFRQQRYEDGYPFKTYEQAWRECFERVFHAIGQGDTEHALALSMLGQASRPLYKGAAEVVARLGNADGLKVALLSNADNKALDPLVAMHGLKFDQVVSSETARAYKPVATAFQFMLDRLRVPASECVYVGDSQHDDVQGATRMGMQTVWVNRNRGTLDARLPEPDHEISELGALFPIVGPA